MNGIAIKLVFDRELPMKCAWSRLATNPRSDVYFSEMVTFSVFDPIDSATQSNAYEIWRSVG